MTTLETIFVAIMAPFALLQITVFVAVGWRLGTRMMDDVYDMIREEE